MTQRTRLRTLCACLVLLLPARVAGQNARASYEELQTFSAVLNLIRLNHADSMSYTPLVRAAIEAALSAVDPHSRYVRSETDARLQAGRSGELGTPGIQLDDVSGAAVVTAVGRGGPGDRAGLRPGDRIIAVQGVSTAGLRAHDVELLLIDAPGTERTIVVERGAETDRRRITIRLQLKRYTWPNVSTSLLIDSATAYVRLDGFGADAAREVERAIDALRKRGAQRVLLDLRGNPGGLLTEAVALGALFLPRNTIVFRTVGRRKDAAGEYRTSGGGSFRDMPLVILVDGGSASAAEAFAGSIQDHGRALIAGHRTYGKALVQAPFPLPAGDVVWLTVARVVTPSGRMIQRSYEGITPAHYREEAAARVRGDTVAGNGGILPDTPLPARTIAPHWLEQALRDGLVQLAAQSAALDTADDPHYQTWREPLLASFHSVYLEKAGATPPLTPAVEATLLRELTAAAVSTRRGDAAAAAFLARTDTEVAAAAAILRRAR